jgi:hypothetical protein
MCGNNAVETGEVCDGADLAGETCVSQGFDAGTLLCLADCSGFDTSGCHDAPAEWRCEPGYYGDGWCDCGCGVIDVDCADSTVGSCEFCNELGSCGTGLCPANIDPDDNSTCTVPAEWTCNTSFYGASDGCDCGCGALDPDCSDVTVDVCHYCNGTGSCGIGLCPANIDPNDNSTCLPPSCGNDMAESGEVCDGADLNGETCASQGFASGTLACLSDCSGFDTSGCSNVPPEWRCEQGYYGDGWCDCGCGAVDSDCTDATVGSCEFCNEPGSCGTGTCPANIDPDDNSTCTVPAEWTCNPDYYGVSDGCDCGCGALDPDCSDVTVDACIYCNDPGSCGTGSCPANIDPSDNSTCI